MPTARGFSTLVIIIVVALVIAAAGAEYYGAFSVPISLNQAPSEVVTTTAVASTTTAMPTTAAQPETLFYGSRAGMLVTVVSKASLDSANAVIKVTHTRANAISFCEEYVVQHPATEACIQDELAVKLQNQITGNCSTGVFTDFHGVQHQYLGANPNRTDLTDAPYVIKDLTTGTIEGYGSSSGYSVNAGIYSALCPNEAPADFH